MGKYFSSASSSSSRQGRKNIFGWLAFGTDCLGIFYRKKKNEEEEEEREEHSLVLLPQTRKKTLGVSISCVQVFFRLKPFTGQCPPSYENHFNQQEIMLICLIPDYFDDESIDISFQNEIRDDCFENGFVAPNGFENARVRVQFSRLAIAFSVLIGRL